MKARWEDLLIQITSQCAQRPKKWRYCIQCWQTLCNFFIHNDQHWPLMGTRIGKESNAVGRICDVWWRDDTAVRWGKMPALPLNAEALCTVLSTDMEDSKCIQPDTRPTVMRAHAHRGTSSRMLTAAVATMTPKREPTCVSA